MINDKTNAPVAVPDERAASIRYDVLHEFATKHRVDYNELCTTARAALATTPAAAPVVPKWIDDPHDIEQGQMLNPEWVKVQEVASAPAAAAPVELPEPYVVHHIYDAWSDYGAEDDAFLNDGIEEKPQGKVRLFSEAQVRELLATATGRAAQVVDAAAASPVAPNWKWMTHPSHNNGNPIPVFVFVEQGVTYYRPFDTEATEFEWELRDDEWAEFAAPQPQADARDAESDYQRGYRHGYNRRDAEVQGALL